MIVTTIQPATITCTEEFIFWRLYPWWIVKFLYTALYLKKFEHSALYWNNIVPDKRQIMIVL